MSNAMKDNEVIYARRPLAFELAAVVGSVLAQLHRMSFVFVWGTVAAIPFGSTACLARRRTRRPLRRHRRLRTHLNGRMSAPRVLTPRCVCRSGQLERVVNTQFPAPETTAHSIGPTGCAAAAAADADVHAHVDTHDLQIAAIDKELLGYREQLKKLPPSAQSGVKARAIQVRPVARPPPFPGALVHVPVSHLVAAIVKHMAAVV